MGDKKEKFDKIKWTKEHKMKFACDLNIEEYKELCKLLEKNKLTKVQFVRNAFNYLKNNSRK